VATYYFTAEEVFTIVGRGAALVGFAAGQYGCFHVGDSIEVKRPDGSVVCARISGVEYPPSVKRIGRHSENPRYALILELPIDDVPIGSEVWA
jgi:hypothetical protein